MFNGSGVFQRLYSWSSDALAGIKIRADRMDNEMNGMATGLSTCITKDGQTTVTANLPMASFKHTGVGAATNRTDYAQAAQLVEGVINWKVAGGTGDALTAAYTIPTTTLVDGQLFYIRASAANTLTAPTFSPDGLTARTITAQGGSAIAVGAIQNLVEMVLRYNLANTRYEWVNYSAGNVVGQSSSVDSELALFSGTGGKTIKRATGTGFVKVVSGVLQTPSAAAVTDLVSASTSAGVVIKAANGTDVMNAGAGNTANATFYGNVSMNTTGKIVNMADPTSAQDAATKAYVDASSSGWLSDPTNFFYYYEDFVGTDATSFTATVSGAGTAAGPSSLGAYGSCVTGSTSTGRASLGGNSLAYGGNYSKLTGSELSFYSSSVTAISDATNRYTQYLGWHDGVGGTAPASGIFFRHVDNVNSDYFQCVCRAAGTETVINTTVSPSITKLANHFRWVGLSASSVEFFINGVSQGIISTNVPALTAVQPVWEFGVGKSVGSTLRGIFVNGVKSIRAKT